jgi:beta-galactosidase
MALMASGTFASAASLTDVYNGRRGANFNSGWKFALNPAAGSAPQAPSFNDGSWLTLDLPHDWSIGLPYNRNSPSGSAGGYLDGGTGWYRKTFTVPAADSGKKIFIEFDGVYMNSTVWINGNELGNRPFGYASFEYELTSHLHYGATANVIAVRALNDQPNSRWYSGSGIYRNVWLTKLNPVHVDYCGLSVSTPSVDASNATVKVIATVKNQSTSSQSVSVKTSIYDASGSLVQEATSGATNINAAAASDIGQNLQVSNPELWSPSKPDLYLVKSVVLSGAAIVDSFKTTLGIRYFNFDANEGFSLNGRPMKIQGTVMHQDFGCLGRAINYRAMERQAEILKNMGCNAIRTAHNAPSPEFMDICNRKGIMVMEEAFDCWEQQKIAKDYHLYFNAWAETDLKSQVRRDRSNPSVILWSIGNEIYGATDATAQKLRNWIRTLDTSRPVTWATDAMGNGTYQQIANGLDLAGYNYAPGRYPGDHQTYPARKIFGSETSAARRTRGVYVFPPTKSFGNLVPDIGSSYDNSFAVTANMSAESDLKGHTPKYVAGEFVWTGFDYLGENDWPTISNNDGIVDRCGFPKDIYYLYQSQWTSKPMAHILPHWNWKKGDHYLTATDGKNIDSSTVPDGFTVPVWVYTNCDSAELFLNEKSLGVRKFQSGGALHLEWNVPFSAGTLRVAAKRGGVIAAVDTVRTAEAPAKVALSADRNALNADGEDLAFITADILDPNGVPCPRAGNKVDFSITGPGTILGVDNGNSMDASAYKAATRSAFNGKCLAVVRSTGAGPGEITVTASSNGLASGSITLGSGTSITKSMHPVMALPKSRVYALADEIFAFPKEFKGVEKTVSIYALSGKLLLAKRIKADRINLRKDFGFPAGTYIVQVQR